MKTTFFLVFPNLIADWGPLEVEGVRWRDCHPPLQRGLALLGSDLAQGTVLSLHIAPVYTGGCLVGIKSKLFVQSKTSNFPLALYGG